MNDKVGESLKQAYREKVTDVTTYSGIPVKGIYAAEDIAGIVPDRDIGLPGQYPFTRGHHPLMYRGKLWNIREISGISTPAAHNSRCRFLLEQGQGALHWELDGPSQYGIEPDQPYAEGQAGLVGVTLHCVRDIEVLCRGLPLDELSLSCNCYYPDVWHAYLLVARRRGYDIRKLRGVGGAINYYGPAVFPSKMDWLCHKGRFSTPGRWSNDFCEYLCRDFPNWNIWSASVYDIREGGADAFLEIAYALSMRDEFVREMKRRGVPPSVSAPKLSPCLAAGWDFFEDIAKMRAARRLWARSLKEKWGVSDPKALVLRFHVNVSGHNYTYQQPLLNIARGAIGALAAVLGGTMGLQVPSYDEAWATPTEEAAKIAVRTQQMIRHETGAPQVADPLGGSYYVEWLTTEMEKRIEEKYEEIEAKGGWIACLESGLIHAQLQKNLLKEQSKIESGERVVVGVNRFVEPEEKFAPQIYAPDTKELEQYMVEYKEFKTKRERKRLREALENLRHAAEKPDINLVPYAFEALEADATFPEIVGVLRMVDGMDYDWAGEREYEFA